RPPIRALFPYTTLFRSWAHGVQLPEAGAEDARVLTFLELVGVSVAIEAEPVREQVAYGRAILVAVGQLEVRRIVGDGCLEIDLRSEEHTSELQSRSELV